MRGYCGIGIVNTKTPANVGTLWRTAAVFGVSFIFTVARRYKRQPTDVRKAWKHVPLWHFATVGDLLAHIPYDAMLIGVETDGEHELSTFSHPERAVYLLGAEDHGLTVEAKQACHRTVRIPGGDQCLNVASAGAIVLYDRSAKGPSPL